MAVACALSACLAATGCAGAQRPRDFWLFGCGQPGPASSSRQRQSAPRGCGAFIHAILLVLAKTVPAKVWRRDATTVCRAQLPYGRRRRYRPARAPAPTRPPSCGRRRLLTCHVKRALCKAHRCVGGSPLWTDRWSVRRAASPLRTRDLLPYEPRYPGVHSQPPADAGSSERVASPCTLPPPAPCGRGIFRHSWGRRQRPFFAPNGRGDTLSFGRSKPLSLAVPRRQTGRSPRISSG